MTDLNQLKARLLTGNSADADAVLALAAAHGISLSDLLHDSFLKERLDRWFETGEHIDSMFEDDHLFTHYFGSDGRFEMKIQGFSYYTSDLTSERTLLGRWRLAGMTPACFVLQLYPDEPAEGALFFISTAACAEMHRMYPDLHSPLNGWMKA